MWNQRIGKARMELSVLEALIAFFLASENRRSCVLKTLSKAFPICRRRAQPIREYDIYEMVGSARLSVAVNDRP